MNDKTPKTKRSIGPAGASIVSDDGMKLKSAGRKSKEAKKSITITDDDLKNMPKFLNMLEKRGRILAGQMKKDRMPIYRAKGGEVKGYMGGGSVHKNKKNMITTKGWGASRKT